MEISETTFRSTILGNERRLWFQRPINGQEAEALLILLDGEYYVERMNAPELIDERQATKKIPPLDVVFVSHIDGMTRWRESFCNVEFAHFLSDELVPWARNELRCDAEMNTFLAGLSLTGLAVAHAALACPGAFTCVLCQSASFWWSDGKIVEDVRQQDRLPQRFRITCGSQETKDYVEHGPDLIQRTSQLASNRAMRDALIERGHAVSYEEFDGGHDIPSWRQDLAKSLVQMLSSTESDVAC